MNRKKYCIIVLIFIVATILSFFIILINEHNNNTSYLFDENSIHFDIEKRNVKLYMQTTKNTMCIFFNTECDLCIEELLYIKDNLDIFSCKYNLILISFEDTKKLMDYKNTILSKDKNSSMIFVSDSNFKLIEKYNVSIFPTILIFSKDGVQKSRCNGINIDFLEQLKCNIK